MCPCGIARGTRLALVQRQTSQLEIEFRFRQGQEAVVTQAVHDVLEPRLLAVGAVAGFVESAQDGRAEGYGFAPGRTSTPTSLANCWWPVMPHSSSRK